MNINGTVHLFFILSLKYPVHILYLQHISVQTSPVSNVQEPQVGMGLLCRGAWVEGDGREGGTHSGSAREGGLGIGPCLFQDSLPARLSSFRGSREDIN